MATPEQSDQQQSRELMSPHVPQALHLTTELILDAIVGKANQAEEQTKVLDEYNRVEEAIKLFEKEAWFEGGWQEDEHCAKLRGHAMTLGDIEALSYSTAGRTMITLRNTERNTQITMITAEDEKQRPDGSGPMGLQSIDATSDEAIELLNAVRLYRKAGIVVSENKNVRIHVLEEDLIDNTPVVESNNPGIIRRSTNSDIQKL